MYTFETVIFILVWNPLNRVLKRLKGWGIRSKKGHNRSEGGEPTQRKVITARKERNSLKEFTNHLKDSDQKKDNLNL